MEVSPYVIPLMEYTIIKTGTSLGVKMNFKPNMYMQNMLLKH